MRTSRSASRAKLGAQRVIVSDATSGVADSVGLDAPLALASHLVAFLFHQPNDSLGKNDALVRGNLTGFQDFEVSNRGVEQLVKAGRDAARKALTARDAAVRRPPRAQYLAISMASTCKDAATARARSFAACSASRTPTP